MYSSGCVFGQFFSFVRFGEQVRERLLPYLTVRLDNLHKAAKEIRDQACQLIAIRSSHQRYSANFFKKFHKKTHMLESLFDKVAEANQPCIVC